MIRLGKKSVVWKWIISYFSVTFLLIFCNLITYEKSKSMIKNKQEHIAELILEQITERFHDNSIQIQNLHNVLLNNSKYRYLSNAVHSSASTVNYNKYLLYMDLKEYLKINNNISTILLYFEDSDQVISTNSINNSRLYWEIYKDTLPMDYKEWNKMLTGDYNFLTSQSISTDNDQLYIYSVTVHQKRYSNQKVNLFFFYTADDLKNILFKGHYDENITPLLIDPIRMELLFFEPSDKAITKGAGNLVLSAIQKGEQYILAGENSSFHISKRYDIPFGALYLLISDSVYLENIQQFKTVFTITFIISILFTIFLICLYTRNNYKPLQELMNSLSLEATQKKQNEFSIVKEHMSQVKNSYHAVSHIVKRQNKLLQEAYLNRLLTGDINSPAEETLDNQYEFSIEAKNYFILLFYIEETADSEEQCAFLNHSLLYSQIQFILTNVFTELLMEQNYFVQKTLVHEMPAFMISIPDSYVETSKASFERIMKRGFEFLNTRYGIHCIPAISNLYHDMRYIHSAYLEALQALELKRCYGLDDLFHYSDIVQLSNSSYYYPHEIEFQFIHQIQSGNERNAVSLFEDILDKNMNGKGIVRYDILQCLFFDILGSILKALYADEKCQSFFQQLEPYKRLTECHNVSEIKLAMENIVTETCSFFAELSNVENNQTLCQQIRNYIRENYMDPNLSLTSLSEHFHLTPVNISRIFRETTGSKIPNVITELRLEEAKKKILLTDLNLRDIAYEVGFGSSKTFTRTFKHFFGCTPGQWRDQADIRNCLP